MAALLARTAAAEAVTVPRAVHPGYGRPVFEWPSPTEVETRRSADRLTLRFARPVAPDLEGPAGGLRDDLVELTAGAHEREIVLRLLPEVEAEVAIHEARTVALDLTAVAAAPSVPVELRTGVHDGFVRIVLDWRGPIGFATAGAGRRWRILFDREGEIDAAAIARRFPELLEEVSAHRGAGRSELALALRPGVRADVFEVAGERVVVDLQPPGAAWPSAAVRPTSAPAAVAGAPDQPVPSRVEASAAAPAPAATAPAAAAAAGEVTPQATAETAPAADLGAGEVTPLTSATAALAVAPAGEPRSPTPAETAPARAAAAGEVSQPTPLTLSIGTAELARGVALDFAWSEPIAAAFLLRAGHLWSVFAPAAERAGPPVLPSLASPVPGHLGSGELVEASGGIAIRFPLRRPLAATVERAGARWRVVLDAAATPPAPVRLERRPDPPRLRLAADEKVRLVSVIDPEVGDRLELWPLLAAGRGHRRAQRLVDLELLATAQGLAWRTLSDRVQARIVGDVVELSAPEGLRLSLPTALAAGAAHDQGEPPATAATAAPAPGPDSDRAEGDAPRAPRPGPPARDRPDIQDALAAILPTPPPGDAPVAAALPPGGALGVRAPVPTDRFGPLGLTRFATADGRTLREQRAALQGRIAGAPKAERSAARLELARVFLAQGMAAEALAVLARLGPLDAGQPDRRARAGLAGAAELLMGRLAAAAAGLAAPDLDDDPETALWRAALAAARQDWPGAAAELERSGATLDGYPPALQLRLGLTAARIAIEAGDDDRTGLVLARLAALGLHPVDRARVAFVGGLAQVRRGELDRADEIWRVVAQGPTHAARIAADQARTTALLDAGRLDLDEAAKLADARALWRGHPLEFEMLDALAELHLREGDPAAAMRIWHELLTRFAQSAGADRIATKLRDSFVGALLGEGGMAIDAVQAYALYQDFPTLLRFEGALGDRIRSRLAAALAGLDLIEPAAGLFEELVGRGLDGPDRAAAGADLAELWLRVPDTVAALDALGRSEVAGDLPPALRARRRLLRARALAAADQPDAALALLDVRAGPSAQRLRAEILWQERDWPRLAAVIEALLADHDPAAPLSAADQELVIRLAIAHARQGQQGALSILQTRFGRAMRGAGAEQAFLLATAPPPMTRSQRAGRPEAVLAEAAAHLAGARAYLAGELTSP